MKERIVSGIQPSGELHIGNYLGALKDFVELQDKYECFFFIADLHSLTEDYNPKEKAKQITDLAATFLAIGLDPTKCTMFIQSHIPEHTELAWIFNTITPMNELERMTQYKDKASRQKKNINVGLFDYPVLQAADILLYHPQFVPVGSDQVQHLEMTNLIARKFNNKFGEYFKDVKPFIKQPLRIMSLTDPDKKMSKSEPDSTINMADEPDVIRKKLSKAVTATDAPKDTVPKGVQNLFDLLEQFGKPELLQKFQKEYNDSTIKYSELKAALADIIAEYFADFRTKKSLLMNNPQQITDVLTNGAAKARVIAQNSMSDVRGKTGLIGSP